MKYLALLAIIIIGATVSTRPFACFPRMTDQPNLRHFEREMPPMPKNSIPVEGTRQLPDNPAAAAKLSNPVKATPQAVALGRYYYGYYCGMCHGANKNGDGEVGRSYRPKPADLTDPRFAQRPDGELAYRMVSGPGHAPVLAATVPLERRWYIVHYLKASTKKK
jgi:hypothetical protein